MVAKMLKAASKSCCIRLPAFSAFAARMEGWAGNFVTADSSSQVIIVCLVALGVRATPDASLIGVDTGNLINGALSLDMIKIVGARRELLFNSMIELAVRLCSRLEVVNKATKANIEALAVLANLLLYSETVPARARFFLRQAYELYKDAHSTNMSDTDFDDLKATVGPILRQMPELLLASLSPTVASSANLADFFGGSRVQALATLLHDHSLDAILVASCSATDTPGIDTALTLIGFYVTSLHRSYAELSTGES
ncbi:hypothetical protein RQP46_006251 [Phenoliferia psychrophenolica]